MSHLNAYSAALFLCDSIHITRSICHIRRPTGKFPVTHMHALAQNSLNHRLIQAQVCVLTAHTLALRSRTNCDNLHSKICVNFAPTKKIKNNSI